MGARLVKAFNIARETGGAQFQMRLAMKSGMSSKKASEEPDSQENIAKMESALKDVTGKSVNL